MRVAVLAILASGLMVAATLLIVWRHRQRKESELEIDAQTAQHAEARRIARASDGFLNYLKELDATFAETLQDVRSIDFFLRERCEPAL
jgi:type II secretory pathway pseudopilin PulG